jgi:hypothetical protein
VTKMRAAQDALRRMRPAKMDDAREALVLRYGTMFAEDSRKRGLGKRLLAGLAFEEIYAATRLELEQSGLYEPLTSVSGIDRVVITPAEVKPEALSSIPGYVLQKARYPWGQSYRTAIPIKGSGSVSEVIVESRPLKQCFPPNRVVVFPRDTTLLRATDLAPILERLTGPKFQLVEVACDFPFASIVDTEFVERHGVFGKSRPHRVGQIPAYDSWGGRKGSKFVKSYYKPEISGHRVELEFHAPDLASSGISSLLDFEKFAVLIPEHHISFGRIDYRALECRLTAEGYGLEEARGIRQKVKGLEWNLCAALAYLRRSIGLTNVGRILTPLDDANLAVKKGLEKWAAQWLADSTQVRKNP